MSFYPKVSVAALAMLLIASAWSLSGLRGNARELAACGSMNFENSSFVVCAYDPRSMELRLASRSSNGAYLRSFDALDAQLGADAQRLLFAMNAGMFNDDGAPIGLYVEAGEAQAPLRLTDGPGNFHMKPNGVFWLDTSGSPHIDESARYARAHPETRWATQSGPMLVIDGAIHPRISANGASRFVRNGVGISDTGVALFAISSSPISFGRFGRFFRDALSCNDALFLDGAVSSLWAPSLARRDGRHAIGPIVVVLRREPR